MGADGNGIDQVEATQTPEREMPVAPVARLPLLTVLRFPAAFAVFVFHATLPQTGFFLGAPETKGAVWWAFGDLGAAGVTFFFILSGFVITWSTRPGDSALAFWRRRFVKIVPVYWVSGLVAVLVAPTTVSLLPGYLLMTEAWSPDPSVYFGLNPPGWSLCVEALFYALFPLTVGARIRVASRRSVLVAGIMSMTLIIGTVLLAYALPVGGTMAHDASVRSVQYWILYVFPVLRLPEFVLGVCAAIAVRRGRIRFTSLGLPATVLALSCVTALFLPSLWSQKAIVVLPCLWLIAAAASLNAYGARLDTRQWGLRLGEWSFAFYLIHVPILILLSRLAGPGSTFGEAGGSLLLIAAAALLSLGASAALFYGLEKPIVQRWGSRRRS